MCKYKKNPKIYFQVQKLICTIAHAQVSTSLLSSTIWLDPLELISLCLQFIIFLNRNLEYIYIETKNNV